MTTQDWQRLCQSAKDDADVEGLVLTGGRGKGVYTEDSDWDAVLVVADTATDRWGTYNFGPLDVSVLCSSDWVNYANPDHTDGWRAYDFAYLTPVIARQNFGDLLTDKGLLEPQHAREVADASVDACLNSLYRATKNHRDGNTVGYVLDASEMLDPLLTALFALENRVRPYNKFLLWDLQRDPLGSVALSAEDLAEFAAGLVRSQDLETLWTAAQILARSCRKVGVTNALDSWQEHLTAVRPSWSATSAPGQLGES